MLETQAKSVTESKEMGEIFQERKPLIRRIIEDSRGWIDAVIMIVNGTKIALTENSEINVNSVAEAAYTIAEATLAVIELFESRKFKEMDLQIWEGRHLITRWYKGCYIVALTKPNPNLGLIKLALSKNLTSEKLAERVANITEKIVVPAHTK